ncbi:MAG: PAS domain-containing protein [Candidatus Yonathbacteria bacterium]|nr:PAS domain-containing protein [Candidatus Yonathbacteria bacterium]
MKLRTKATLFLGTLLIATELVIIFSMEYIMGGTLKTEAINTLRSHTEQVESSYGIFLKSLKRETLDWTADQALERIIEDLLAAEDGTSARTRATKEFASYVTGKKMPYDKSVLMADILDKKGIVIASTRSARIGTDELSEETLLKAHNFSKTIVSELGETFVKSIIFETDETPEPMIHVTVRFFRNNADGTHTPLDAVLLVHFLSVEEITTVLSGEAYLQAGATTGKTFLEKNTSSDIYLVNSEKLMVTPSRYVSDIKQQQKVDTLPVRECLENDKEIDQEYDNYRGTRVLGASVCFPDDKLVLITEISKDEILATSSVIMNSIIVFGGTIALFGIVVIAIFFRRPLQHIEYIGAAVMRIMNGDFNVKVKVDTKDEIGTLATMFNKMVLSVRQNQEAMQESKRKLEENENVLKKDILEHEKQQKFLEQSKKATLNLLEDSFEIKQKLEEEGDRLQTILASIEDGLILIDTEYKIVLVNARTLKIFAMPVTDVLGKDLRDIMKLCKKKVFLEPREWPTEEVFITKKAITTTLENDFCITTKGLDTQLPVAFSFAPLAGKFSGIVVIVRDVTRDRELDEAKSGFVSVASHQLRTPLTSIRWYSEMLLSEDAGALNPSQKDFMNEIHGGAERLYQTVDLLLGISRVESGKLKADKTPIDLGVFTAEIRKELAPQIDEKNLAVTVAPPERDPVVVWLDPLTLRQVVLNLFSNAIRYTNEKGIIEVKWRASEDGKEVVYTVHDNGIGIPEAVRSRIFSKFFRAENARAQVPDGSGLGLSLVKDLVESWGGKVWFETSEGNGTTFFFTVPLSTQLAK